MPRGHPSNDRNLSGETNRVGSIAMKHTPLPTMLASEEPSPARALPRISTSKPSESLVSDRPAQRKEAASRRSEECLGIGRGESVGVLDPAGGQGEAGVSVPTDLTFGGDAGGEVGDDRVAAGRDAIRDRVGGQPALLASPWMAKWPPTGELQVAIAIKPHSAACCT